MLTEKNLERALCSRIKANKGMAIKLWAMSMTGLPDRLILMPGGKASFAEIKTTGQKPKLVQRIVHDKLRQLGFTVAVIDSQQSLDDFVAGAAGC